MHKELKNKTYHHSKYHSFYIQDPKLRHIHKATVKDRILHHAVFRILYLIFDKTFIFDSYSCRLNKGTHRAINRFREFARKANRNNTRTCFVLKCDIRKFFDSINHTILIGLIKKKVDDENALWLIEKIINSFSILNGKGIPMGNITSQLFANIYLNNLDRFVKHKLRVKYYMRYCDDFLILSERKSYLESITPSINIFLKDELGLSLHPDKIFIKTLSSGVDFLGWINFRDHRVLRTTTRKRMFKKLKENKKLAIINSYAGLLKHGNTYKLLKNLLF